MRTLSRHTGIQCLLVAWRQTMDDYVVVFVMTIELCIAAARVKPTTKFVICWKNNQEEFSQLLDPSSFQTKATNIWNIPYVTVGPGRGVQWWAVVSTVASQQNTCCLFSSGLCGSPPGTPVNSHPECTFNWFHIKVLEILRNHVSFLLPGRPKPCRADTQKKLWRRKRIRFVICHWSPGKMWITTKWQTLWWEQC